MCVKILVILVLVVAVRSTGRPALNARAASLSVLQRSHTRTVMTHDHAVYRARRPCHDARETHAVQEHRRTSRWPWSTPTRSATTVLACFGIAGHDMFISTYERSGSKLTWSRRRKAAAPPFAGDRPCACPASASTSLKDRTAPSCVDTHVLTVPLDRAPTRNSKDGTVAGRSALENNFQERVTSSPALGNAGDAITRFWKYSHL
jgi:hypothetical protein